jgi:hypothetical protein
MLAFVLLGSAPALAEDEVSCEMDFSMKGWAVVITEGKGEGKVVCSNGETAEVAIASHGIGLSAGKAELVHARGEFTGVSRLEDLLGTYSSQTRTGGAGEAGGVALLTKGSVSLTVYAKGEGMGISTALGRITIARKAS